MIARMKRYSRFIRIKDSIISVKKYFGNRIVRAEASYFITRLMYWKGYPQDKLMKLYNLMLGKKSTKSNPQDSVAQLSVR
jgi:hypothetical protein